MTTERDDGLRLLRRLGGHALTCAEEAKRAGDAYAELDSAIAEVLYALCLEAAPMIQAAGTRPKLAYDCSFNAQGSALVETDTAPWRGILLNQDVSGPGFDNPRAFSGRYKGRELWLAEADNHRGWRLVLLTYDGEWSSTVAARRWWRAGVAETSPEGAVSEGFQNVESYLIRVAALAERTLGTRVKSTRKAEERAERLRATARLLGGER